MPESARRFLCATGGSLGVFSDFLCASRPARIGGSANPGSGGGVAALVDRHATADARRDARAATSTAGPQGRARPRRRETGPPRGQGGAITLVDGLAAYSSDRFFKPPSNRKQRGQGDVITLVDGLAAHSSNLLRIENNGPPRGQGGAIALVDGVAATRDNIHDLLIGGDVPGTHVQLIVAKGGPSVRL